MLLMSHTCSKPEKEWQKNPNFIEEVSSHFTKDDKIVVGCQSGRRSLMAAKDLIAVDFTGVTDVGGGYSTWVQSGLPIKT